MGRAHSLDGVHKCARRAAPSELLYVTKELSIGPERCESLEQQCKLSLIAKNARGKRLDRPVLVQEASRGHFADALDAGIPVLGVADQREKVRNELRADAKLCPHALRIAHGPGPSVDLHDAIAADALGEVLV